MAAIDSFAAALSVFLTGTLKPFVPLGDDGNLRDDRYSMIRFDDILCTDSSPYCAYFRRGSGSDLFIFFDGGGVAWNEECLAYPMVLSSVLKKKPALYAQNVGGASQLGLFFVNKKGILDPHPGRSPVRDWNTVILPYGTGDFFLGSSSPVLPENGGKTPYCFQGYKAFQAVLERICRYFPSPEKIVIAGMSAGAMAVSALAGEIIDCYPDCGNITVCVDSSLIERDDWQYVLKNFWESPEHLSEKVRSADMGADFLQDLSDRYGGRAKILYSNSVEDFMLGLFRHYMQTGEFTVTDDDCRAIREGLKRRREELRDVGFFFNGFPQSVYPVGTEHCVLTSDSFYKRSVDGITYAQWLSDAIGGTVRSVGTALLNK